MVTLVASWALVAVPLAVGYLVQHSLPTRRTARERLIKLNPTLNEVDWDAPPTRRYVRAAYVGRTVIVGVRAAVAARPTGQRVAATTVALISALTLFVPPTGDGERRSRHDSGLESGWNVTGLVT